MRRHASVRRKLKPRLKLKPVATHGFHIPTVKLAFALLHHDHGQSLLKVVSRSVVRQRSLPNAVINIDPMWGMPAPRCEGTIPKHSEALTGSNEAFDLLCRFHVEKNMSGVTLLSAHVQLSTREWLLRYSTCSNLETKPNCSCVVSSRRHWCSNRSRSIKTGVIS